MKKFDYIDTFLMLLGLIISCVLYWGDKVGIFYGFIFATAILFAIRTGISGGFTLKRFKRKS